MNKYKGDLLLLLAAFIGGGGFISIKYLLDWGYSPYVVIFGRFLIATIFLGICYIKQIATEHTIAKITNTEWKVGTFLGVLLAATFFLLTIGLQYTTPSVNAFLCNTQAIVVPLICWIGFRQRPSNAILCAAMITLIGVSLLSITDGLQLDFGAVLSFGASIAFSLQMAYMGKLIVHCDALRFTLVENIVVTIVSGCIVLFFGKIVPPLSLSVVANFLYAGVLCTGLYFILQSVGQQYTTATKTALIITTESIFAALISALLYGERLSIRGYIGCILIFGAVLFAELPQKKAKKRD